MIKQILALAAVFALTLGAGYVGASRASDHDDGETELKGRNLSLTDLYVFREKDQDAAIATSDLIFVLNCAPRSVAQQRYFFSTKARYQFHVTRVAANTTTPTGQEDVILRFEFGAPDANNQQAITVTAILDGQTLSATKTTGGADILTSKAFDLAAGATTTSTNTFTLGTTNLTVFAGLREDPFFFDVERFFEVRKGAQAGFRTAATSVDFAAGYNVLSIVVRVPLPFLQGTSARTIFDTWQTIFALQ